MQIHLQKVVNAVKPIYYKDAKLNYIMGQVLIIQSVVIVIITLVVSFLSIKYFCYY